MTQKRRFYDARRAGWLAALLMAALLVVAGCDDGAAGPDAVDGAGSPGGAARAGADLHSGGTGSEIHSDHDEHADASEAGEESAHAHAEGSHEGDDHEEIAPEEGDQDHAAADHEHGGTVVAIPPATRQNLGITFVTVELRPVQSTVRLPGQFELRPAARREYHVMLPGRIELLVDQYERVDPGRPLFHLDSPEWRKLQSDMVEAYNAMRRSHADVAVAEAALAEQRQSIGFLEQRIANLAEAQVRQVELEAELARRRSAVPRLQAEIEAARMAFQAAHTRYDVMLSTAASLTGIAREALDPHNGAHTHLDGPAPAWRSIDRITVHAEAAGVVDRLAATNRGWAETGDLVLDTVDPVALRFHADALQTDIALFEDGQPAKVAPPPGGSVPLQDTIDGSITVGFQAHPEQRTVPIYLVPQKLPRWAKAGVTAYLEVFIDKNGAVVPAVPEAAVVRDGLEHVLFRRAQEHPDEVVRIAAELGARDGRWVEIRGGVKAGDEVVLGGVYPLMLATSSSGERQAGGHMHADGTLHTGEDH